MHSPHAVTNNYSDNACNEWVTVFNRRSLGGHSMVMVIVVIVCMVIMAVSVNYSHLAVIVWSLHGGHHVGTVVIVWLLGSHCVAPVFTPVVVIVVT